MNLELHYKKEEETLQQLLVLEDEFRDHHKLTATEIQYQRELLDRLWILSQRYIILITTGNCCSHPEIYVSPAEEVILQEYNEKLGLLRESNCRIMESLHRLRVNCQLFEELCSKLDMTVESPFILGDSFHKPISFFMELVSDLFKYFHAMVLKFKYRTAQLDPSDFVCIEDYQRVLEPSEDFEEYLTKGLIYCKCLRPRPLCRGASRHTRFYSIA